MDNLISQFNNLKNDIFKLFNCPSSYFIKCADNVKWKINNDDTMSFLTYTEENGKTSNCVIINRENKPMIYKYNNFTMVIAIECVKTAIILKNENMIK